jgi:hypothetical protein
MSSTRHATDGELHQERYLSGPAFEEKRGLKGHHVAERAALLDDPRARSLLFFLQALSHRPGGMQKVARDLIAMFPERLGSPTMHRIGGGPGKRFSPEESARIGDELHSTFDGSPRKERSRQFFLEDCLEEANSLYRFLERLCLDPEVPMEMEDGGPEWMLHGVHYFRDVIGALYEFQSRYAESVKADFVLTEIGAQVFSTLDFGLHTTGMVVLEGLSRTGKTAATKAWCEQHLGEARFVSLTDARDQYGFFRTIAKALGLPCTYTKKAQELRDRIEDMLIKSRLLLVIDEAHYLWTHGDRIKCLPHRVNWVLTALCNEGVPVALVTTEQFALKRAQTEKQTEWSSQQLSGRIRRYRKLPLKPRKEDLEAVSRKLLPEADKDTIGLMVANAIASGLFMTGIVNTVEEARYHAKQAGRKGVTFEDVHQVFETLVFPSAVAQKVDLGSGRATAGKRACRPVASAAQKAVSGAPAATEEPEPGTVHRKHGAHEPVLTGNGGRVY